MNFSLLLSAVASAVPSLIAAILSVTAGLFAVYIIYFSCHRIISMVRPPNSVYYGGRFWEKGVYNSAMRSLHKYRINGGTLDQESREAYREWRNESARKRAGF
jgi:biopolymer transport protein ExbB/TolQ